MQAGLELCILPLELAVCRLEPGEELSPEVLGAKFLSLTRTEQELSLVVPAELAPPAAKTETGWSALGVKGVLDFSLTGVLASLAAPLAVAGISIFAISTHDTDYLLVKKDRLEAAVKALEGAGHCITRGEPG